MKKTLLNLLFLLLTFNLVSQIDSKEAIVWKFKTNDKVYASPVLKDNIIYVGSLDNNFYAINAKTGKEKWHFTSADKILSTAVIEGDKIIFESGNTLYALNLKGKLLWKFDMAVDSVKNQIDPWDFHHSSPIIHKGVVYIGTEKGLVYGIDVKSGKQVLKIETRPKEAIRCKPLVFKNKIFFGDWVGNFYAYNLKNGEKIWSYDTKNDGIYGWKNSVLGNIIQYKGAIIFQGKHNRMYSLNAQTGKKNWQYSSPTDQWLVGGPLLSKGTLYFGSSDQHLFQAMDASTGKMKWQTKLDCRIWGEAAEQDGKLFIGSNSFFIIDKESGKIAKEISFPKVNEDKKYGKYVDRTANFHSSPVLNGEMAFVGSDDGCVYGIKVN